MGLFDFIKKKEEATNIWEIRDKDEFVMELLGMVEEKCDYGENMTALNEQERVFYIVQQVEMEVNNGGFSQFFYNDSGNFANEIVAAFEEIFAYHTAGICRKAVDAFGGEIPVDRDAREELMDELECSDESRFDEILDECDEAFYEYKEDLTKLCYDYAMRNRYSFEG